eukprot:5261507-Prymnesium_polylepis.1
MQGSQPLVDYVFPVPPGTWLAAKECKVDREPCPAEPWDVAQACEAIATTSCPYIARRNASVQGVPCPEATFFQPCRWWELPDGPALLGQTIFSLPRELAVASNPCGAPLHMFPCVAATPVEQDFPYDCSPGLLASANMSHQLSPFCAGLCPEGHGDLLAARSRARQLMPPDLVRFCVAWVYVCPSSAVCAEARSIMPEVCKEGGFCPAGSSYARPCPAGRFSNAIGLSAAEQCSPCPPGSACSAGTAVPAPCAPGSIAATPGASECEPCSRGTYQSSPNSTACEPCEGGSFCRAGSTTPLPCPSGRFSASTNLSSPSDCTACPPGSSCTTGSLSPTLCLAGSFADEEGQEACTACVAG